MFNNKMRGGFFFLSPLWAFAPTGWCHFIIFYYFVASIICLKFGSIFIIESIDINC